MALNPGEAQATPLRTYYAVFAALMTLLGMTVAAAFVVPHPLGLAIAMLIAAAKAALVILFFMHVRQASALTKIFVVASLMWLAILFTFTFGDYLTRGWTATSRGWSDRAEAEAASAKP